MEFRISPNSTVSITPLRQEKDTEYYQITVSEKVENLHIEWAEPMVGHYSVWHPMCGRARHLPQWFAAQKTESCFYRGAPVIATFTVSGENKVCVAIEDTKTPLQLGFYVDDYHQQNEVFFTLDSSVTDAPWSTVLRIDRTRIPASEAIHNVSKWWNQNLTKQVPEEAYAPLYSSWYNFHQDPSQEPLTNELRIASELGFKTFILDDGWQIEGSGTKDYMLCGDWIVAKDKFPDFKKFIADVHSFGIKAIIWFSVPFVGFGSKAYARFQDKLLFEEKGYFNAGVLDIRYPEIREYIVETFCRFVREYGIDGLKLDFIDFFRCYESTPAFNEKMDCETVEKAVTVLLQEIEENISAIKSGFLYEYRQFYIGPSILAFGNMIRVADCAFDSLTNRIGVADLRMLTDQVAVHSDMLLWSPEESPENCAMQLLNVLFSAVQISVRLAQSSPEQIEVIRSFLQYATENRDVLLKGQFNVNHPELNYTRLSSEIPEQSRKITVLYAEQLYEYTGMDEDIWNGNSGEHISIINPNGYQMQLTVLDFTGKEQYKFLSDEKDLLLTVPRTGRIQITNIR